MRLNLFYKLLKISTSPVRAGGLCLCSPEFYSAVYLIRITAVFWRVFSSFSLPVYAVGDPPFANSQESIIEGAIDFHIHSSPDVIPRRLDDFEVAKSAARSHMKAVVLKNHFASTAARAVLVHPLQNPLPNFFYSRLPWPHRYPLSTIRQAPPALPVKSQSSTVAMPSL